MGKRILVIDDNKDILEIITITLKCEGFEVISSDNADIFSELESIKPDLILLDNWIGNIRGSDLCKTLKDNKAFSHIPVILLSAVHDLEMLANECQADAYLEKPFELIELETIVHQLA
jgi:DNA-binding response OmpR family regulator